MIELLTHVELSDLREFDPFFYLPLTDWGWTCGECEAVLYGPIRYGGETEANQTLMVGEAVLCVRCGGVHFTDLKNNKMVLRFDREQTLAPPALAAFQAEVRT